MPKFNIGDVVNLIDGVTEPKDTDPRVRVKIKGHRNLVTNGVLVYDYAYLEDADHFDAGDVSWAVEEWFEHIPPVEFAVGDIVEVVTTDYDDIGLTGVTGRVENVHDNITVSFPDQLMNQDMDLYRDDIKLVFRPVGVKVNKTSRILAAIQAVFDLNIDDDHKIANIKELLTELE